MPPKMIYFGITIKYNKKLQYLRPQLQRNFQPMSRNPNDTNQRLLAEPNNIQKADVVPP